MSQETTILPIFKYFDPTLLQAITDACQNAGYTLAEVTNCHIEAEIERDTDAEAADTSSGYTHHKATGKKVYTLTFSDDKTLEYVAA